MNPRSYGYKTKQVFIAELHIPETRKLAFKMHTILILLGPLHKAADVSAIPLHSRQDKLL